MRAEIKEAVRCSQSANDAWLETRRDVADLSVFLNNQHHHREPTTQDYLAALRLAPDAFAAIKWPITRYGDKTHWKNLWK
jgi:nitroreductase